MDALGLFGSGHCAIGNAGCPPWRALWQGQRVRPLLDRIDQLYDSAGTWVPTPQLNRWLEEIGGAEGSSVATGHGLRLYYVTQTGVHPPSILIFCNDPRRLHFSSRRYLENSLRRRFDFGAAPIRLVFRARRPRRSGR